MLFIPKTWNLRAKHCYKFIFFCEKFSCSKTLDAIQTYTIKAIRSVIESTWEHWKVCMWFGFYLLSAGEKPTCHENKIGYILKYVLYKCCIINEDVIICHIAFFFIALVLCFQAPIPKRKKGSNKKKNRNFKSHNEHMDSIFKDYSDVKK